jgi:AAA domain/Bifunctional DNA primase/polymerase, N-terminal
MIEAQAPIDDMAVPQSAQTPMDAPLPDMWRVPFERGWSVFPLQSKGKRPIGKWECYQTQLPIADDVRAWANNLAGLNVGIVTGAVSGLVVVDLDNEEAKQEAERLGLPSDTVIAQTPRGLHVYFRHPGEKISNRVGIFPGADFRGDGGYVVAPGSKFEPTEDERCDGKVAGRYTWLEGRSPEECELADLPQWLAGMLIKPDTPKPSGEQMQAKPVSAEPSSSANHEARAKARASAALIAEIGSVRAASAGERNDTLNKAAFSLGQLHADLPADQTKAQLRDAALSAGLEEAEIAKTIESAWNSGAANPRGPMPERPISGAANATGGATGKSEEPTPEQRATHVIAKPYEWRGPESIPMRPWIYGQELLRGSLSALAATGGMGKSSLIVGHSLALVTGRKLLHQQVWDGPKRVWYWNLEDSNEEIARSIQAACKHWHIAPGDVAGRLFLNTGLDGDQLCITVQEGNGIRIARPITDKLVEQIKANAIDVLIIDPFVGCHSASENDNMAMDKVAKEWARVATQANCALLIVHHTKKLEEGRYANADSLRGASAVVNAARSVVVLNPASRDEAGRIGVTERYIADYFRGDDGKANRARKGGQKWYRRESVSLGNGFGGFLGDEIAVIVPHTPPDAFEGVTVSDLAAIQARLAETPEAERRANNQATGWVGHIVADVLGYGHVSKDNADDDDQATEKRNLRNKINHLIRQWVDNGALIEYNGKDQSRKTTPFIEVGRLVNDSSAPPKTSGAERGGAVEQ